MNEIARIELSENMALICREDGGLYDTDARAFRKWCETTGEVDLTPDSLERFKTWLWDDCRLSASTVARRVTAMRGKIKVILDRVDLPESQAKAVRWALDNVKCPKRGSLRITEDDIVTEEEFATIMSQCKNRRASVLMKTLWVTGCRVGEVLGIQEKDIKVRRRDAQHAEVKVRGKGSKERIVFLPLGLLTEIREVYKGREWIFQSDRFPESAMSRSAAYGLVRLQCALILGRHVHPHTFRHSFATRLIENGVDINALSSFLGHTDIKITASFYLHSTISPETILRFA